MRRFLSAVALSLAALPAFAAPTIPLVSGAPQNFSLPGNSFTNSFFIDVGADDTQLTLAIKAMTQAEAITAALVPDARGSEFADLAVEAIEALVPGALNDGAIKSAMRKQAISVGREVVNRLPSLQEAAFLWMDQLQKGQIKVKLDLTDLDKSVNRFDRISRLVAVAIVITGMTIGSALAASVSDTQDGALGTLSDVALWLYTGSMALAVVLVVVLLLKLVRPEGRKRRRDLEF